ncbi:hypothetical protein Vretimale_1721 [Volvox reticuliferus]|uniref:F-box domain-containing protein n=1 Tax=Volvox reticuliferus TaxID=1737510 RepID=A0A8J4D9W6_9CHLO|nr:hypothetical protein Vretimale_1721 [Volvox reticuliferus]
MAQGCFRPTMGVPDEQNPTGHDAAEQRCHILEILPQHILLEILRCLDAESLCFLAQTCHAFLQICGMRSITTGTRLSSLSPLHSSFVYPSTFPSPFLHHYTGLPPLWPGRRLGGPLIRAVRYSLSTVLRVPPQMFAVRLEEGRSSKFPVSVPLHNLRSILGAADVDFLAERTSGLVQDLIARNPPAISYCPASASGIRAAVTGEDGAQEAATNPAGAAARGSNCGQGSRLSRPSAALLMCRADRGFVRLGLRPGVAVARVLLAAPFFTALHRPPRAEQLIPPQPGPGSAPVPPRHTRNTDGWSAESVASATASETVICAMQQRSPASSDSRRDAGSGCGGGDRLWDDVCNASELGTGPSWDVAAAPAGANQTLLDQLLGLPPACLRVISSYCCRCGGGDSGRDSGRDDSRYHCDNCSSDATTRSSSASINGTLRVGGAIGSGAVSSTTSTSAYTGRVDCQDSPRGWKSEGRVSGRGSRPLQGFIDAVVGDNESSASGSNGSSAGCKGGDAGKGRGKCSAACRSSVATGAHVAALTAAAVASQEVAQLQLLELALAGVPYAVAAWQDFVAGCQQVAAARLRVAATAAAPLGSTANDLPPYPAPQPLLAVAAEVEAEQDQGGVDASDALGKGRPPGVLLSQGLHCAL